MITTYNKVIMNFLSTNQKIQLRNPIFVGVLANTELSTVDGLSGAGPSPKGSLLVPVLDAELITTGRITTSDATPNTKSGCPTPASITRAMLELSKVPFLFVNAGMVHTPTVPMMEMYGKSGIDPRSGPALPDAEMIIKNGEIIGSMLSKTFNELVIGECVPGGTTTALCVLRALGINAKVSSASINAPSSLKEEVWDLVHKRIGDNNSPDKILLETGDPMMAAVIGLIRGYKGTVYLAGGTQMLSVTALLKEIDFQSFKKISAVVTTVYVRDDKYADCAKIALTIGIPVIYVDPDFGNYGHSGLARYCIGEVKEGMGCGGAMFLAYALGKTEEEIRDAVVRFVDGYCSS